MTPAKNEYTHLQLCSFGLAEEWREGVVREARRRRNAEVARNPSTFFKRKDDMSSDDTS